MSKRSNVVRKHLSSRELKKLQKRSGDKQGALHELVHDGLEIGLYLILAFIFVQFAKGYIIAAASAVSSYAQSLL